MWCNDGHLFRGRYLKGAYGLVHLGTILFSSVLFSVS